MVKAMAKHSCFELVQSWREEQAQAETRATQPLSPQDVEAIRRRLREATSGPWKWTGDAWNEHRKRHAPRRRGDDWVYLLQGQRQYFEELESKILGLRWSSLKAESLSMPAEADMELIANAPTDLRHLCDALDAAWAEIAALKRQHEQTSLIVASKNGEEALTQCLPALPAIASCATANQVRSGRQAWPGNSPDWVRDAYEAPAPPWDWQCDGEWLVYREWVRFSEAYPVEEDRLVVRLVADQTHWPDTLRASEIIQNPTIECEDHRDWFIMRIADEEGQHLLAGRVVWRRPTADWPEISQGIDAVLDDLLQLRERLFGTHLGYGRSRIARKAQS